MLDHRAVGVADAGPPAHQAGAALAAAIKEGLAAAADPARAPGMQAYMRSDLPCLGVAVPAVRAVTRKAARKHPPGSVAGLGATAAVLWRGATHREHRYAATELTRLRLADGARIRTSSSARP